MTRTEKQTHQFFRAALALRSARSEAEIHEGLDELLSLWLHARSAGLQRRCAELLDANGWQAQMQDLCEKWAH